MTSTEVNSRKEGEDILVPVTSQYSPEGAMAALLLLKSMMFHVCSVHIVDSQIMVKHQGSENE